MITTRPPGAAVFDERLHAIDEMRIDITEDEVRILWPKINLFVKQQGRNPDVRSHDPLERRMAEAVLFLQKKRREAGL